MNRKRVIFALAALVLAGLVAAVLAVNRGPTEAQDKENSALGDCVGKIYYAHYKAVVDSILQERYVWESQPLMTYQAIQKLYQDIADKTRQDAGEKEACGKVDPSALEALIEQHRASRPEYTKERDSLCMAVYLTRRGFNPCDH